jgi:hypothetical protein
MMKVGCAQIALRAYADGAGGTYQLLYEDGTVIGKYTQNGARNPDAFVVSPLLRSGEKIIILEVLTTLVYFDQVEGLDGNEAPTPSL